VVLLGELRPLRGQALLHLLLLGHRLQGTLRVGRGRLQAHVLQCHAQQLQDVDSDRVRRDCPVRVHQEANRPDPPAARAVLDAPALPALDILALLRLVGVHQLLQRRLLQSVESPALLHGEWSAMALEIICLKNLDNLEKK